MYVRQLQQIRTPAKHQPLVHHRDWLKLGQATPETHGNADTTRIPAVSPPFPMLWCSRASRPGFIWSPFSTTWEQTTQDESQWSQRKYKAAHATNARVALSTPAKTTHQMLMTGAHRGIEFECRSPAGIRVVHCVFWKRQSFLFILLEIKNVNLLG